MSREWLVVAAAVVAVAGYWSYGRATLAGRTQPNRVTWGLWGIAPMIAFAGQVSEGVRWPALLTLVIGLCPLVIVALSFANPDAYWALRRRDLVCLGISAAALAGWALTRHGVVAIALALVADGAAGLPTIVKAWRRPDTETPTAFGATALSGLLTLASLGEVRFETAAFPILIGAVGATLYVLVRFPTLGPRPKVPALAIDGA